MDSRIVVLLGLPWYYSGSNVVDVPMALLTA
jgi:hypothetical protein